MFCVIGISATGQHKWIKTDIMSKLPISTMTNLNLWHVQYIWVRYHKFILHSNKHQCPHLVPSVGCPFSSALALILFHPILPSFLLLNVFVQIWNRDEGHFVQGLFFLVGDRQLISRSPLTSHPLDFLLLFHLLLGLGKLWIWVSQRPLNLVLSSLVFLKNKTKKVFCHLPTCHATHLCPSLFLFFCLYVSPSLWSLQPPRARRPPPALGTLSEWRPN